MVKRVIIAVIIALYLAVLGGWINPSNASQARPMVSMDHIIDTAGCHYKTLDIAKGYSHNFKMFACLTRGGVKLTGENYTSRKNQNKMIREWQLRIINIGETPFWMVRCNGYSMYPFADFHLQKNTKAWSKRYVHQHKSCKIIHINGSIR
jgi:hypothetical protein